MKSIRAMLSTKKLYRRLSKSETCEKILVKFLNTMLKNNHPAIDRDTWESVPDRVGKEGMS